MVEPLTLANYASLSLKGQKSRDDADEGKFLIKVGQRPGIPVHLTLTAAEHAANVHDTNKRWTIELTKTDESATTSSTVSPAGAV